MKAITRILPLLLGFTLHSTAQTNAPFDGRAWNVSTGNLSVDYIQASPIGAFPRTNYTSAPPPEHDLARLKSLGMVAYEDYIAWGAVERAPGQWDWTQHDAMERAMHKAGLKYVVYDWVHFPPLWLRDDQARRTLMKCNEHGRETFYLSIFDPRTIQWYDHFYKKLYEHFGNRIDTVYACALGPYGEGNFPLEVTAWVNMGHCHEGYWAEDKFAIAAFQKAMKLKYHSIKKLNRAWKAAFGSFADVLPPKELEGDKFVLKPEAFPTWPDKRRWLDFILWYQQSLIDFTGESVRTVLKYFPASKVRLKPGGSSGSINPVDYGTYCPGFAKMAGPYHIVLQPADCMGAVFADKWVGTAYQYYRVTEGTEPAGELNERDFVRRMFSDASAGAAQFFSYEFEKHTADMQRYVHLYTGKPGETEIALFCPTTYWLLGGDLSKTLDAAYGLRDLCEFDVLDELLIADGILKPSKYKVLVLLQGAIIDRPILKRIDAYQKSGGKVIVAGKLSVTDVEGKAWTPTAPVTGISSRVSHGPWRRELGRLISGMKGVDGKLDGLWTCQRGSQVFIYNTNSNAVQTVVFGQPATLPAEGIWESK